MEFCEDALCDENPKFIALIKSRYSECEASFRQSDEMLSMLAETRTKMEEEKSKLFVHLKDFLTLLKSKRKKKKKSCESICRKDGRLSISMDLRECFVVLNNIDHEIPFLCNDHQIGTATKRVLRQTFIIGNSCLEHALPILVADDSQIIKLSFELNSHNDSSFGRKHSFYQSSSSSSNIDLDELDDEDVLNPCLSYSEKSKLFQHVPTRMENIKHISSNNCDSVYINSTHEDLQGRKISPKIIRYPKSVLINECHSADAIIVPYCHNKSLPFSHKERKTEQEVNFYDLNINKVVDSSNFEASPTDNEKNVKGENFNCFCSPPKKMSGSVFISECIDADYIIYSVINKSKSVKHIINREKGHKFVEIKEEPPDTDIQNNKDTVDCFYMNDEKLSCVRLINRDKIPCTLFSGMEAGKYHSIQSQPKQIGTLHNKNIDVDLPSSDCSTVHQNYHSSVINLPATVSKKLKDPHYIKSVNFEEKISNTLIIPFSSGPPFSSESNTDDDGSQKTFDSYNIVANVKQTAETCTPSPTATTLTPPKHSGESEDVSSCCQEMDDLSSKNNFSTYNIIDDKNSTNLQNVQDNESKPDFALIHKDSNSPMKQSKESQACDKQPKRAVLTMLKTPTEQGPSSSKTSFMDSLYLVAGDKNSSGKYLYYCIAS